MLDEMHKAREYIAEGLAQRAAARIKVRQPLAAVEVPAVADELRPIIAEELNVKEVKKGKSVKIDTKITPQLKEEGLAREIIRFVQNARKDAGLNVDDRIHLRLESEAKEIKQAADNFDAAIFAETLATGRLEGEADYRDEVSIEGQSLTISLSKA